MIAIYSVFTILEESMTIYQNCLTVSSTKSCTFLNNKSFAGCIILMTLLKKMIHVGNRKRSIFLIYYLIVPGLNLGHYQEDSFTYPILITVFLQFNPKVTGSPTKSLSLTKRLVGFEPGTFKFNINT